MKPSSCILQQFGGQMLVVTYLIYYSDFHRLDTGHSFISNAKSILVQQCTSWGIQH